MAMKKVKIEDASTVELIEFARVVCGIPKGNVPDNTGRATVIAKIKEIKGDEIEEIEVPDIASTALQRPGAFEPSAAHGNKVAPAASDNGQPTAANGKNDPKVELTLFKTDKNKGNPIEVSVNGRQMLIPVGVPCEIPLRFFLALCDAISVVYDFNENNNEIDVREEPRHPFNVHNMPSKAERMAWDEALSGSKAA